MPEGDPGKVDENLELAEEYILRVREDIQSILKLLKISQPKKIDLYVASDWKRKLREIAARERKFDFAMKIAMADETIKAHSQEAAKVLASYMKNAGALGKTPQAKFELEALESAKKLFAEEFGGAEISVMPEDLASAPKAKFSLPGKPSILVS
jgi:hypothetical protein